MYIEVETQKSRFAHIDASELYNREALATTSQDPFGLAKSEDSHESPESPRVGKPREKAMSTKIEDSVTIHRMQGFLELPDRLEPKRMG